MIDWKRKLTSRKFWVAVVALVSGLILAFGGKAETAETVGGCIMSAAAVIAYIVGEGLADAAHETIYIDGIGEEPLDTGGDK